MIGSIVHDVHVAEFVHLDGDDSDEILSGLGLGLGSWGSGLGGWGLRVWGLVDWGFGVVCVVGGLVVWCVLCVLAILEGSIRTEAYGDITARSIIIIIEIY